MLDNLNKMNNNKKCRILLVDDDEINRIYFRDIFWIHGNENEYDVISTTSIKEARNIVENIETKPNVIFIDTLVAEKGERNDIDSQIKRALDFVSDIKKDKKLSDIKIIIYSSQKDKRIEREFIKIGADDFIIKGELLPKEIITFTNKIHECYN
jgi:CheY-like chemotaxis protein